MSTIRIKDHMILSVVASLFIGIGGCVYLSCEIKIVGAILFAVALLSINCLGLNLFTGKIGYLALQHEKEDIVRILVILIGNIIGTWIAAWMAATYKPALIEVAQHACENKLMLEPMQALVASTFCGIMMYTAVELYKSEKTYLGIMICVPVFILSGFEHSIADMFYFFTAGMITGEVVLFQIIVIIGNAIGGMLVPAAKKLAGE